MSAVHLGLLAGAGPLSRLIAQTRRAEGDAVTVLALNDEAVVDLADFAPTRVSMAQPGRIERLLKDAGCTHVTLAGRVTRPDFAAMRPDFKGVTLLPKVAAAARKGDGAMLNLLVAEFEKAGFVVKGAHEWLTGAGAPAGRIAGPAPSGRDMADIGKAAALNRALGPFDVAQACVVCEGAVLAVEAAEGTDAMLARIVALPESVRGTPARRRGVLWKAPKPHQDVRADMPVIGAQTMRRAAAAGLAGVGVAAGATLILERDEAVRIADAEGLFLVAFDAETPAEGERPW